MKNAAISMLNKGITTFVDFREGGICGINMLQTAIKDIPIKSFILGRFDFNCFYNVQNDKKVLIKSNNPHNNITKHHDEIKGEEILKFGKNLLDSCNGFGISGANENEDNILKIYKNIIKETNKQRDDEKERSIIAIHAAESIEAVKESLKRTGKTEIERTIFTLEPDFYIHITNPTRIDLDLLQSLNKAIVVCPRANGILGTGIVPLRAMIDRRFTIAIGTDNIMLNSPDLFKIHNLNIGFIDNGFQADLVFIDKYDIDIYPMHDPYMSVVHRCSERAIKAIMVDGKFVDKKYLIN
jgi:hypothetical protein